MLVFLLNTINSVYSFLKVNNFLKNYKLLLDGDEFT